MSVNIIYIIFVAVLSSLFFFTFVGSVSCVFYYKNLAKNAYLKVARHQLTEADLFKLELKYGKDVAETVRTMMNTR